MNEKIQSLALAYAAAFEKSILTTAKEEEARQEANIAGCKATIARERLKKAICEANGLEYPKINMRDVEETAGEKV
jgi:hypothetical protein